MRKENEHSKDLASLILHSKKATLFMGIIAIVFGIIFAFVINNNTPVTRDNAIAYNGYFEKYETRNNYCGIVFQDGSTYEVYPHTEKQDFRNEMNALPKGTKLYLLINPNNNCVAEIKTDTKEILNFEASQEAIDKYDNGYVWIGMFICFVGVLLIIYPFLTSASARKEEMRQQERKQAGTSEYLRRADMDAKCRILLEKNYNGYRICYRRVKITNELVVNGYVYDEKKAILEFDHNLTANVNDHIIEAGLKEEHSYIRFDGTIIGNKKRTI